MQKKILFIEPPFYRLFKDTYSLDRHPLSLGYLAAVTCKETDWQVMVYNADFSFKSESWQVGYLAGRGFTNYLDTLKDYYRPIWQEIRGVIEDFHPQAIGISAKSQNFASARMIARIAKDIDNNIKVIIGGPHSSMAGKEVLSCPDIDISVRGEGELTVLQLLNAIASGDSPDSVKGIVYRKGELVLENPPREFIQNLDTLPLSYFYTKVVLKDFKRYPKSAFGYLFATRGCPYNCFFCGSRNIWSRNVRFRSPENIVKEIKFLHKEGIRIFSFADDIFGVNREYLYRLCHALIQYCPGIKWSCEFHAKLVDDGTISIMKRAGCYMIQLGVESGNNEILRQMRKNITIEEALAAAKIIKRHKIQLQAFFIVGFLQETEETLRDTVEAMRKIKCDVLTYSIFTPYPNTDAFNLCKEKGLIGEDYDISLYNHQSPENNFCLNIPKRRFRELAIKIEKMVDRKNKLNRIKRIFNPVTFEMIREKGTMGSLYKAFQVLRGR